MYVLYPLLLLCYETQIQILCPELTFDVYVHLQAETKFYTGLLYYGEGGNQSAISTSFYLWFITLLNILLLKELIQIVCICAFVLQCPTPVLSKESPRFRWVDSSHSYRWAKNNSCHNVVYWSPENPDGFSLCSLDRNCPALCHDVMKWWSTLFISWLHSTTATSKTHEQKPVRLHSGCTVLVGLI